MSRLTTSGTIDPNHKENPYPSTPNLEKNDNDTNVKTIKRNKRQEDPPKEEKLQRK